MLNQSKTHWRLKATASGTRKTIGDRMESDWKKFRSKLDAWRERYLATQNARLAAMLLDESKTPTERFWNVQEAIAAESRTLQLCLDDYSRSNMWIKLMAMRSAGMIQREDLAEFSEELQRQVFDARLP